MTLQQLSQKMRSDTEQALSAMQREGFDPKLGPVMKLSAALTDSGPRPINRRPVRPPGNETRTGFAA